MLPLALALAQAGPLARPVTFDEPAMPLARLLPALGKTAGVEVVAGNVAKDVALVRVKERSLGEVLKRLAEEDGAEVEATKTGFRLVRTAASERKARQAALAARVASIKPALDQTAQSLAQPADEAAYRALLPSLKANRDGAWVRSGAKTPRARLPMTRAAMRAILLIPAETLASLQEGDRIVYSNRPTRLQRPLPALGGLMKTLAKEQSAWAGAAAKSERVEPGSYVEDPFRHVEPLDAPPARAVLVVKRTNSSDAALATLVALDANGEEVGTASYGVESREMQRGMAEFQKPSDPSPVATSLETQTMIDGLPKFDGSGPSLPSPAAQALLSTPETRDPLSFGATDLMRDLAGDRPLVAVLPDMAWFPGLLMDGGLKRSDRAILATVVDAREEGGWLLARPREPETARRNRVDRAALGRFIRAIVAQKRVPLDAYAAYAWTASDAPSDVVGVPMAMMLAGGTFNPDVDWASLRLFGSLSPTDRKAMLAGGTKEWATMSAAQRTLATRILERRVSSMMAQPGENIRSTSLWKEPTEIYAGGYDDFEMRLSATDDRPLYCDSTTNKAARGWRRVLDERAAATTTAMPNGPGFDRFGYAERRRYGLSMSARRGVSASETLEDVVPPKGPLKPLSEMPETFQKAVEAERNRTVSDKGGGRAIP